ncbi:MAG: PEP-CTERM sorting domain-containing protein [Pirellula sp.]
MKLLTVLLFALALCGFARGDLVYTVTPSSSTVAQGQRLTFQIHLHLTPTTLLRGTPPQSVTRTSLRFDAIDFQARAGAGDGTGGLFTTDCINHLLNQATPSAQDQMGNRLGTVFSTVKNTFIEGDPFEFGVVINSTPQLLATLFLDTNTTGVVPGTYNFTLDLDKLAANSNTNLFPGQDNGLASGIPTTTNALLNTIQYTITPTAVPEPSSIIGFSILATCGTYLFARRRKLAMVTKLNSIA